MQTHAGVPCGSRGFEYKNNYIKLIVQIKILKMDTADGFPYSARKRTHTKKRVGVQ
jgi:hypothetical protein